MSIESMVTQADRQAAADLIIARPVVENPDIIIHGGADDGGFVQAFAKHRTAAQPEREGLEEAVERRAKQIGDSKRDPNWWRYLDEARAALTTPAPAVSTDEAVWIWSDEHQAYWRPEAAGYTRRASEAGIYSRADAERRTSHCGPEKRIEIEPVPRAILSRLRGEGE